MLNFKGNIFWVGQLVSNRGCENGDVTLEKVMAGARREMVRAVQLWTAPQGGVAVLATAGQGRSESGKIVKGKVRWALLGFVGPFNLKKILKGPAAGREKRGRKRITPVGANFWENILNHGAGDWHQTQINTDGEWAHTEGAEGTEAGVFVRNRKFIRLNPTKSDLSIFSKPPLEDLRYWIFDLRAVGWLEARAAMEVGMLNFRAS